MKEWFHQRKSYGLGNFIMSTPMLQVRYKFRKKRINVYFDNKDIELLYRNCYFINILDKKPKNLPFATSYVKKRLKGESDIESMCRCYGGKTKSIPHTYIDNIKNNILAREDDKIYVAVFHGCLGTCFEKRKDIGANIREYILEKLIENSIIPVILGAKSDILKYWKYNDLKKYNDSIFNFLGKKTLFESIGILNSCDYFMSNDTGLYHVAASYKKKGLVLWNDTRYVKNKTFFNGITNCITRKVENKEEEYKKYILNFIEKIKNENSI